MTRMDPFLKASLRDPSFYFLMVPTGVAAILLAWAFSPWFPLR
jgi:hypothetical protein